MREVFSDLSLISPLRRGRDRAGQGRGALRRDPGGGRGSEIARRTDVSALDFDLLRRETDIVGYPILPLVHQMAKQCGEAGRYVHWGATTQDIMDTAVVLQVRAGLAIIEAGYRGAARHPRRSVADATATRRWRAAPICSRRCR